ncbi:unnamed protein product [Somion occarium]|uniref:Carbonic anhydrase n=1 Tax=Somion occarium TaxID=3059160 RepID=A0ABP1CVE9_9APHY
MSALPPDAATLLSQNKDWASKFQEDHPGFLPESADGQRPRTLWLGCSDSRVPESVITAAFPGDIFVHRNIGNQASPNDDSFQSVLEFTMSDPNSPVAASFRVEHIVIVGHIGCGAVEAGLDLAQWDTDLPDKSEFPLIRWILPIIKLAKEVGTSISLDDLIKENIRRQVDIVAKSTLVQRNWEITKEEQETPVTIHGWLYHLGTGLLEPICEVARPDEK